MQLKNANVREQVLEVVSIPLSRDSHCNGRNPLSAGRLAESFNPSVEGQPLQPGIATGFSTRITLFQSLCRGTAIATSKEPQSLIVVSCFNPYVEGQPLQLISAFPPLTTKFVSIPLSRDSHCNRAVAEALISNGYNRLFF